MGDLGHGLLLLTTLDQNIPTKSEKSRFKELQYKSKVGIYGDLGDGLLLF